MELRIVDHAGDPKIGRALEKHSSAPSPRLGGDEGAPSDRNSIIGCLSSGWTGRSLFQVTVRQLQGARWVTL
jgi:hypothetical protein